MGMVCLLLHTPHTSNSCLLTYVYSLVVNIYYACSLFYLVTNSAEVIGCYYTYLLNTMDADSVSHLMYCNHLITDDDYEAITAAPNDSKMNSVILEYARAMDWSTLFRFTDLLIGIETQQSIGEALKKGMYIYVHMSVFLYCCRYL